MRRILTTSLAIIASLGIMANVALADDCVNLSRSAPDPAAGPIFKGNWVWLPSVGVPEEGWGFAVPGGEFSSHPGNFRNFTVTGNDSLLVNTGACANPNRQTTKGIQNTLCQ